MRIYIILFLATANLLSTVKAQAPDSLILNSEFANAVLWTRTSGEFRALNFQAYNFAKISLDNALKASDNTRPQCVIVDIDETILDNSAYYEYILKEKKALSWENWKHWLLTQTSDTIPGAVDFLRYAASKNVEVFYVTNREEIFTKSTLDNLRKFNFPNVDSAHYLPSVKTYDKDPRRALVAKTHEILLFAGDNLSDFSNFFYEKGEGVHDRVNSEQSLFGTKFIVLPNTIYGSWKKK